eukprot:5120097-Ditylum_brightwellii.AAC.1
MQVPRPSEGQNYYVIEWDETNIPRGMPLQSHPLTTHIDPSPRNKLILQVAISKAQTVGFKCKTQQQKRRQDVAVAIAAQGSSSASTPSSTRASHRGIPLVAGLRRRVKKGRRGT